MQINRRRIRNVSNQILRYYASLCASYQFYTLQMITNGIKSENEMDWKNPIDIQNDQLYYFIQLHYFFVLI